MFAVGATTVQRMLSDRSYMHDDYPRQRTSVLTWLICAIIAGFVLQVALDSAWIGGGIDRQLGLSIPGLRGGRFWTLLTYGFLHDPHYVFQLLGNLLCLYFIGRELLPMLGSRRFIGLYLGSLLVGGLTWAAVHWRLGGMHWGATAGVEALFIVFACFYPNRRMDFLLFFVVPVSVKPKHLALGLVGLELAGLLIYELPGAAYPLDLGVANSAHLGGMLAGWLYFRFLHESRWSFGARGADIELPHWMKRRAKASAPAPGYQVNPDRPDDLRAEVDRILDKINSHGFGALTVDEKRVLDEARDLLSRR